MEVNQTRPTDVMASKLPSDAPISKQPILMLFVSPRRFQIILKLFFMGTLILFCQLYVNIMGSSAYSLFVSTVNSNHISS